MHFSDRPPVIAGTEAADARGNIPDHFAFRPDSRLFVMTGEIEEEPPMASHYFEFDGNRPNPVKTMICPEWSPSAK